ncbi:hypothetical protein CR513_42640, partial [Mucuna pruriens]
MGIQGCTNYYPELVLKQNGYPTILPPVEETTTPFMIYDIGMQNVEWFRKIRQAWKNVIRTGCECGLGVVGPHNYRTWLRCWVKQMSASKALETFKVELKEVLGSMEAKQKVLKRNLEVALVAQTIAQEEANQERRLNEEISKKA